jgi:hypothetical protein
MATVATTFASPQASDKALRVDAIPEQVKQLKAISCDYCDGKASFDLYFAGAVQDVHVLKRACDACVKQFSQ